MAWRSANPDGVILACSGAILHPHTTSFNTDLNAQRARDKPCDQGIHFVPPPLNLRSSSCTLDLQTQHAQCKRISNRINDYLMVYRVRRAFFLSGEASYVHTVTIDRNISGKFSPAPAGEKPFRWLPQTCPSRCTAFFMPVRSPVPFLLRPAVSRSQNCRLFLGLCKYGWVGAFSYWVGELLPARDR